MNAPAVATLAPAIVKETGTTSVLDGLVNTYRLISEWFLYPEEVSPVTLSEEFVDAACKAADAVDPAIAGHLREFRAAYDDVDIEDYLNLLELSPRCPMYLGSYQFQEPTTCASAGVSDRNQYMLEIGNIFKHFGLEMHDDLPDFLPAIIEFLALTADAPEENAALRERFIERMVWDGVRLFAKKLDAEDTPYAHLAEALTLCLRHEVGDLPEPDPDAAAKGNKSELIQLEGVAGRE